MDLWEELENFRSSFPRDQKIMLYPPKEHTMNRKRFNKSQKSSITERTCLPAGRQVSDTTKVDRNSKARNKR
jgi:hypothetical protein